MPNSLENADGNIMRASLVSTIMLIFVTAATPAMSDDAETCVKKILSIDADLRIRACTSVLLDEHRSSEDRSAAYNNRGVAWKNKGDHDKAIADYDMAIRLNPKHANAYYNRGIAWNDKGDYDKAIADYDMAIRLNPKYAKAYNARCWARVVAGRDLPLALADCNTSLRLRPNDANTFNSRGLVQFKLGAFDQAIIDYTSALAQNTKDAGSLFARGVAKLRSGDRAGGNADIAAAKLIKPAIATAYGSYGVK